MSETQKRNWFELSNTLIENFTIGPLSSSLKNLPLEVFVTAVAGFSGPIALVEDKSINHQFILPQHFNDAIVIMNCKGQFKKAVPFKMKDQIIFFGFTKWEDLLIVDASGDYSLIDCFSGSISQGNYSKQPLIIPESKEKERYRGCIMMPNSNKLILLRQKQLGYTDSPTGTWKPLPNIKASLQNPIFQPIFAHEKEQLQNSEEIVYLTKHNYIQSYNLSTQQKTSLYVDVYLSENAQNLLAISYNKKSSKLALFYSKPTLITILDLISKEVRQIDPIIDLKYTIPTGKIVNGKNQISYRRVSHSKYRSLFYHVYWLTGSSRLQYEEEQEQEEELKNDIVFFNNPKLTLLFDGENTRMKPINSSNYIVKGEIDCIRVYSEEIHEIYRVVPYLYQVLVDIDKNPLQENKKLSKYSDFVEYYKIYNSYLDDQIIDIPKLSKLGRNSQKQKDQDANNQGKEFIQTNILHPLVEAGRFCLDPVDQSRIFKFICFLKNYYNSQIDISETCGQMRVVNSLKFQFLNRSLTLLQFQFLKYEIKDIFLTILLRYNMHFAADSIFGDSESKTRIFLDWAKCKIQKNGQAMAFEEVREKFSGMGEKSRNCKVFTQISKYCIDRNKLSLAQNFIQLQEVPERKVLVYLLIMSAKQEKKMVDKILETVENCPRSVLIFKVIKQLLEATWIQNHLWVNILHGKPNLERHYIRYLKFTNQSSLLKSYYIQNKRYEELGYETIKSIILTEDSGNTNAAISKSYNTEIMELLKQKSHQFQKLLPNLASQVKSYQPNEKLQMLRKVQAGEYFPSEQEITGIKDNFTLECLAQILLGQEKTDLGILAICQISSTKAFRILQRKGRFRDAIQLAYNRKDRDALVQIKQHCPQNFDEEVNRRLASLR